MYKKILWARLFIEHVEHVVNRHICIMQFVEIQGEAHCNTTSVEHTRYCTYVHTNVHAIQHTNIAIICISMYVRMYMNNYTYKS